MADLKISALNSLAGADLVAADVVAVVDDSASETKKLTVSDLIANGTTLISDNTIPSAKILFSAGAIDTAELAASAVETAKINDSAVTAAKLADNSSVTLVSTLPASGAFTGQIALDTDDDKIYIWDGSAWDSVKGAGSINVVNGSTTGEINIVASTSGDTVTISATLDNTTAAAQFLGGPTGAAGAVGYRALVGSDLPTPTTSTKGGVIVNGEGLRMDLDTIEIANDVTANSSTYQAVQFNSKGLITAGRDITAADLPEATAGAIGGVKPGSGLTMGSAGAINHSNAVTGATNTKITFDAQGHVTAGTNLSASDIPDLDTAKITTGTFPTERIADEAVTGDKLANYAVAQISETTPTAEFTSQFFFNPITRDLSMWDGNVFQPIGISAGEIVLAGTYDASTNQLDSVTADGTAAGFTSGSALPAAATGNNRHYVVVSQSGTGTSPAPTVSLEPPDIILSNGTSYILIETSETITAQIASNVGFTATGNIASTNVQGAIAEVDNEKVAKAGDTMTGDLTLNNANIVFEGATENAFETTLTVTDPTADNSIVLPDSSGTLLTTGDTGSVTSSMIADGTIVNADISASAEIAVSKLANGTARQLLQTDAAGTGVEFTSNVDVPGTFDVAGAGTFDTTLTVTGVISADGKVKFPAGTAAAPSFYSGTDTDTGLYFSAADEVSVATGGTQRVVVDSAGRVAVGTSTPGNFSSSTNNLVVSETGGNSGITLHTGTSNSSFLGFTDTGDTNNQGYIGYSHSDNALLFSANSAERFRIDSSGRLLANTTTSRIVEDSVGNGPQGKIQIEATNSDALMSIISAGTADANRCGTLSLGRHRNSSVGGTPTVVQDGDALGAICFAGGDGTDMRTRGATIIGQVDGTPGSNDMPGRLLFSTRADGGSMAERLRIDSSGRVGIGTSSPVYRLDVHASGNQALNLESTSNYDTTPSVMINARLEYNSSSQVTDMGRILWSKDNATDGDTGAHMIFYNKAAGATIEEAMRIDSSGRVGIGTASPSQILELKAAEPRLCLNGTTANSDKGIEFEHNGTRTGHLFHNYNSGETSLSSGDSGSAYFITFKTDNSERMRIDSSGRVLVGTTTEGEAGADNLTIADSGHCGITIRSGTTHNGAIYFSDATSGNAEFDGYIFYTQNTRALVFGTAQAEQMRIDSSGQLLMGSSSSTFNVIANQNNAAALHLSGGGSGSANIEVHGINHATLAKTITASTDSVERMRISSSGVVFTRNPTTTSLIVATGAAASGSNPVFAVRRSSTAITTGTNVFFVYANGSYATISDQSQKKNIESTRDGYLDDLNRLRVVKYNWNEQEDTDPKELGLIAQEVEEVFPGLISEMTEDDDGETTKGIKFSVLPVMLLKALQEASAKIETLEARVAALEAG